MQNIDHDLANQINWKLEKNEPQLSIEVAEPIKHDPEYTKRAAEVIKLLTELIEKGYLYLAEITDQQYIQPKAYLVEISPRKSHGNDGAFMKVSARQLMEVLIAQENQTDDAEKLKGVQQSLIIHELVHNAQTEEDLSMTAEIIYLFEHNQKERITKIKTLFEEGKMPKPYVKGLEIITGWLGVSSISNMLNTLDENSVKILKKQLKEKLKEIYKNLQEQNDSD